MSVSILHQNKLSYSSRIHESGGGGTDIVSIELNDLCILLRTCE